MSGGMSASVTTVGAAAAAGGAVASPDAPVSTASPAAQALDSTAQPIIRMLDRHMEAPISLV